MLHRRDFFPCLENYGRQSVRARKIEVLWNSELQEVKGKDFVSSIKVYNNQTMDSVEMPMDGVFIAIGHKPNTEIFQGQT